MEIKYSRIFRIVVNSFAFVVLLILAFMCLKGNPPLAVLLFLSAFDQLEDVIYYTYGRRLIPDWAMPIDFVLEGALIATAVATITLCLFYFTYFHSFFFQALFIVSFVMLYSAMEDIMAWREAGHYVWEVREEKRFVKRKR
ncbi:MAG TPA: hypothetical protein EYP33_01230 [Pyrodictium sp.]|nr:hypothetical protein [Pyrodictium sp.]